MFERKLIKKNPVMRGYREFGPKGIAVVSSGSPNTRDSIYALLNTPNQTGSVHALVDVDGITLVLPLSMRALGDLPNAYDDFLKVLVCEPAYQTDLERYRLTNRLCANLATCILYLCRHHGMEPCETEIRFVGKANDNEIKLSECDPSAKVRKSANSSPLFDSQSRPSGQGRSIGDLIQLEVKELHLGLTKVLRRTNIAVPESPAGAVGAGDVVLFVGGAIYNSRGASAAQTLTAMPQFGVVRRVYPGSKHCYEVVFLNGTYCVNKSTVRKCPFGRID